MARKSVNPKGRNLCLDKRSDIMHQLGSNVGAILVDPFTGNLFLHVCDKVHVSRLGDAHIGILGHTLKSDNLTVATLKCKLNGSSATVKCLGNVDTAGYVCGTSLKRGKLDRDKQEDHRAYEIVLI